MRFTGKYQNKTNCFFLLLAVGVVGVVVIGIHFDCCPFAHPARRAMVSWSMSRWRTGISCRSSCVYRAFRELTQGKLIPVVARVQCSEAKCFCSVRLFFSLFPFFSFLFLLVFGDDMSSIPSQSNSVRPIMEVKKKSSVGKEKGGDEEESPTLQSLCVVQC